MGSSFVTFARILNILIDIDSIVSCAPLAGFAVFPLPAKKVTWEAPNAAPWRTEFDVGLRERELFGLETDGQLVRLKFDYGDINISPTN